jgi:magnesium transporter
VILRQGLLGFLNGVAIAAGTGLLILFLHGNVALSVVIAVAMVANMLTASLAGAAIPMSLRALGFDPAQASSIFLTTVSDVVGFGTFLGLAALARGWLI